MVPVTVKGIKQIEMEEKKLEADKKHQSLQLQVTAGSETAKANP